MNKNKVIRVVWDGEEVGRLTLTSDRLCAFEYTPSFIANGVSISPFELPLRSGVFTARSTPFEGGFGVFDDALPDGWGRLILDRYLRKQGILPDSLSLLDLLSLVGSTGRGTLEFYPDESSFVENQLYDFLTLASEAEEILKGKDYDGAGIDELYKRGGSPGGARPKIFVKQDGVEWLVKFRALQDPVDVGEKEYEYSLLAERCGLIMPPTRLFEGKYFGVERFDRRPDGKKIHTVSVAGLLRADYRLPCIDYRHIFKVVGALSKKIGELEKVFRLMTFNYLIGNKDDHAKNFSLQFEGGKWHLSPAYDLLPGGGINGYRTTSINDRITPSRDDLIAVGTASGLSRKFCENEYDAIKTIIEKRSAE